MPGENLYIGTNGYVLAIDPHNGQERWRTKLGVGVLSATTRQDVCVLEHEGRVFAGSYGHLFCLDAESGHVLWHNELDRLGHNDVTLAIGGKSIQFVHTHTHSNSSR
jgi:outer membrane protein assembly factor BamB